MVELLRNVEGLYDEGDEVSRHIIAVDAPSAQGYYDAKFRKAFLHMIDNPNDKGLMSTHLFYDLPDSFAILSGGHAWEERIKTSSQDGGYLTKDSSVIRYSLSQGLADRLPDGQLKFISYGGGDMNAFRGNEMQIMDKVFESRGKDFEDFWAVDILERYATNCAYAARNKYRIRSHVVIGDFIYNGRLAIPETDGTPVVMITGGPFENTPYVEIGKSPEDLTALAWAKLNLQHGLGSVVIKTFDTDQKPDLVNGPYAPKKPFEAFLLSAFARAVQQGIIEDPSYDIFANWRVVASFNPVLQSVELAAMCKKDHEISINGTIKSLKQGEARVITLSHKWDEAKNVSLAQRAGFDVEVFREPGNKNGLLIAKAVRSPDDDLMSSLPPLSPR